MSISIKSISIFLKQGDTFLFKKHGIWIPSILESESGFYLNDLIKKNRIVLLERISSTSRII